MNQTADFCANFYEFACGNYIKHAVIDDDSTSKNYFSSIMKDVQKRLNTSLQNSFTKMDPKSFQLLEAFYKVCMNTGKRITQFIIMYIQNSTLRPSPGSAHHSICHHWTDWTYLNCLPFGRTFTHEPRCTPVRIIKSIEVFGPLSYTSNSIFLS